MESWIDDLGVLDFGKIEEISIRPNNLGYYDWRIKKTNMVADGCNFTLEDAWQRIFEIIEPCIKNGVKLSHS
jgi:hypothetical protein